MNKKSISRHIPNNSFTSSLDLSRRVAIRRRLIESKRTKQSQESEIHNTTQPLRNTITNISRPLNNDENNSLIANMNDLNNSNFISESCLNLNKKGKRKGSLYLSDKNELNKIDEEKYNEENINIEIKDTVKCYICFDTITKPKMCKYCHRIACEKCLYNWFIIEKNKKCGFCRENINFNDLISVPFMSTVADFVEKVFENEEKSETNLNEEKNSKCPFHVNENIFYYCLNCNKGYCKICFVFFGKEKDKHLNHNIINYEEYKNYNLNSFKNFENIIIEKKSKINKKIKLCESYKNSYEYERKIGIKFIENLKDEFSRHINDNIQIIENQIKLLKGYILKYDKYLSEINNYYQKFSNKIIKENNFFESQKISYELINRLKIITSEKLYPKKDIEKLFDLSKEIHVNIYHSKLGEFNIDNIFLNKNLKLGDSPYELIINNIQRKEVVINIVIPKDKINLGHIFIAHVILKKKESEIKSYELKGTKQDDNFIYLTNKIPWDYFENSCYKIKGILCDFYFV